jgi:hypothetical protein
LFQIRVFADILPIPLHSSARLVYACIGLMIIKHFLNSHSSERRSALGSLCKLLIAIFMLLHRPIHLPLIAAHIYLEKHVSRIVFQRNDGQNVLGISLTYLCLAQSAFYSFGNTNTISTLDVGPGFTALSEYNLPMVSIQILLSTYSFFLYWILMLFNRLEQYNYCDRFHKNLVIGALFSVRAFTMCVFQLIAIDLRNHLFIWSVVCPKYLYELVHTALYAVVFLLLHFTWRVESK